MNPGTEGGGMLTKVGNECLFMVGAHVAHDCIVNNNVILVNNATLGAMSSSMIGLSSAGWQQCTNSYALVATP